MNSLIQALQNKSLYPHSIKKFEVIETHISWILLTGKYAYKIKKSVNFGFLDFSTLKKRHHYCLQELQLNRRFTKKLYLEVVSISGTTTHPEINSSAPIEYALKMHQFDNDLLFSQLNLVESHIDNLAFRLAEFHKKSQVLPSKKTYGLPKTIQKTANENFKTLLPLLNNEKQKTALIALQNWTKLEYKSLKGLMWRRRERGFIRECHGDLHLNNIVLQNEQATFFDCIEFNPSLRWIDLINELAFITMDLQVQQKKGLAYRLLNHYLAYTGDYIGLHLLKYYQVYRSMVRAKISLLETSASIQNYQKYFNLADNLTQKNTPYLVVMRGLSGSGKSYLSSQLAESLPAIHLNSDIVRKRLTGYSPLERTQSTIGENIYTRKISHKTYKNLLKSAEIALKSGFSVVVDATFLMSESLLEQQELAKRLAVPFKIIDIQVSINCLRQRVEERFAQANDPSEANVKVLEYQLKYYQPLKNSENVLIIHNEKNTCFKKMNQQIMDSFSAPL